MERGAERLWEMAYVNAGLHVAGLAALALGIRPGSPLVPLEERRAWLGEYPFPWMLGWGVWMLCALAFVGFALGLVWTRPRTPGLPIALAIGILGAVVDLACEVLQVSLLPLFAGNPGEPFLELERALQLGGLVAANGLYSLSVLAATRALCRHAGAGRLVGVLGIATALSGAILVVAGLADSAWLAAAGTAPTVVSYVLWVLAVARRVRAE